MQAMTVTEFGDRSKLKLQDMPEPELKENDVLIEVHAAAVNPVDWKVREGKLPMERSFPFVLGYDCAGTVKQVGSSVQGFSEGDAVYCSPSIGRNGSNAELVAVDYRTLAHKPKSLDFGPAAAVPLVLLTAWEALYDRCKLQSGQSVLIQGGGGGVGHVAIQLAKRMGCTVYTTAHSDASQALAKKAGADEVIDYKAIDVLDRVNELTEGQGVNVAFDTVGGETMNVCLDAVALCGAVAGIVGVPENNKVNALYPKSASLHLEFMGIPPIYGINIEHHGKVLTEAAKLIDNGDLFVEVYDTYPLSELAAAHEQQETGRTAGKLVINVK